ncbi:LytR/AlgR family response regulator transcription factor [Draconibacterium sediminis]|uniref:Transcriptional regulator n=1 Tax=Draconibacterium sediminis TaxID=1544798 RepID=A0A0D8J8U7_9BACT|nr:LytTR family DNA-binding domain-containing protein [Draconibacterium sediminis]KJF43312.1 transcriptional regulator [Draconibacterium sediminis]
MNKLKCIAIDDEPLALKQIMAYIEDVPYLELAGQYTSAVKAYDLLEEETIDLMFVDINMPDLNGLDFVKTLSQKPLLIFTTAYSEYAVEGFKVNAIDYLLKPFSFAEFSGAAQKALAQFELVNGYKKNDEQFASDDDYLFIKSEYKLIRINLNDIQYIEGMKEYVRIHQVNQKPVMTLLSMKALEEKLPESKFMRIHRSFIVNLEKVRMVERFRIIFDDKKIIPVSDNYKEKFQDFLDQNFMG